MKGGLLLVVLIGALLISCGVEQEAANSTVSNEAEPKKEAGKSLDSYQDELDKEAAIAFCGCYRKLAKVSHDMKDPESPTLLGTIEEVKEMALTAQKCRKWWDKMYNGKIDLKNFSNEVKKENKLVYDMAVEEGVL